MKLVGLSALMTTTVVNMEATIKLLREHHAGCKVMVGGAVLTQEYADMIGADFYSKDAMGSVRYANTLYEQENWHKFTLQFAKHYDILSIEKNIAYKRVRSVDNCY